MRWAPKKKKQVLPCAINIRRRVKIWRQFPEIRARLVCNGYVFMIINESNNVMFACTQCQISICHKIHFTFIISNLYIQLFKTLIDNIYTFRSLLLSGLGSQGGLSRRKPQ